MKAVTAATHDENDDDDDDYDVDEARRVKLKYTKVHVICTVYMYNCVGNYQVFSEAERN